MLRFDFLWGVSTEASAIFISLIRAKGRVHCIHVLGAKQSYEDAT